LAGSGSVVWWTSPRHCSSSNNPLMERAAYDPRQMHSRTFRLRGPLNLRLTLAPLCRGRGDPTMRLAPDGVWRATRTPDGPGTEHLVVRDRDVTVRAWGPGAEWLVDAAPALVGEHDDDSSFEAHHPVVADASRRLPGLRLCRAQAVVEVLVPTVLEQKVIGKEARRSYAALVRAVSEPAPGPASLFLPPDPKVVAGTPSWAFHRWGVERKRADTVRRACTVASRLEEDARRLTAVPGIGPWTAAEVSRLAHGDPDAVSVGDYHLPHLVTWALAGEPRGDDARMLELLEPYRGHRGRVQRLLEASGIGAPRYGPRLPLQRIATL
jgi:3-methyladenine DNA glycosylase/8-oxoguanine DNA glycosylase